MNGDTRFKQINLIDEQMKKTISMNELDNYRNYS